MARIYMPGSNPAPTGPVVLYGANGQPLTVAAPPTANAQPPAPATPARAPRAVPAAGTVGGYAAGTVPKLVGAGAVPGYNPHRPTGVANGVPVGTRYSAWAALVACANAGHTLAQWAAQGPHCKPKYLARWVAAGLVTL